MHYKINILAGSSNSGEAVYEELVVSDMGDGEYRLERSPGLVLWFYGNVYDPKDNVTPLNWW